MTSVTNIKKVSSRDLAHGLDDYKIGEGGLTVTTRYKRKGCLYSIFSANQVVYFTTQCAFTLVLSMSLVGKGIFLPLPPHM